MTSVNNVWDVGIQLKIHPDVHKVIQAAHKLNQNREWLSVCRVTQIKPGEFLVDDICFPPQDSVGAYVESADMETHGIDFDTRFFEWLESYKWPNRTDDIGNWVLQLHSHHSMGMSPSGVDQNNKIKYAEEGHKFMFNGRTRYKVIDGEVIPEYMIELNVYDPYIIEFNTNVIVEDITLPKEYTNELKAIEEKYNKLAEKEINVEDSIFDSLKTLINTDNKTLNRLKENAKQLTFKQVYDKKIKKEIKKVQEKYLSTPISDRITQVIDNQYKPLTHNTRHRWM